MKSVKLLLIKFTILTFIAGFLNLLPSCIIDTHKPEFLADQDSLMRIIKETGKFDSVGIVWGRERFGDSVHHFLMVQVRNGKNLPRGDLYLKEMGNEMMSLLVKNLKNKSDYTQYRVEFITNSSAEKPGKPYINSYIYTIGDLKTEETPDSTRQGEPDTLVTDYRL